MKGKAMLKMRGTSGCAEGEGAEVLVSRPPAPENRAGRRSWLKCKARNLLSAGT